MQSQISLCLQHWVLTWGFTDMEYPSPSAKVPKSHIPLSQFIIFPSLLFFQSGHIVCIYNAGSGQSSPKSMERFPMSLTASGTRCISLSPSQLTFLQCHGRQYYENQPHSVNSAAEFPSVKLFPSSPCAQWFEAQHRFSMCMAWAVARFHPDFIHGKGKVCHSGCTSFCTFSFIH